ncbi:MAG: IclR family transcriptional regulator C-terminal domain-containing protein, partial [Chloroflexota bacterium]
GLTEIAVPVYDYQGHVVAAISIGGPTIRLSKESVLGILPQLREAATDISGQLGYRSQSFNRNGAK